MEKSYRIHTDIINDVLLDVNMKQDFDFLEVLSLKLRQKDAYRLHSSNYGVVIGRVLANDAFGIPNAKVSVFIERDADDPVDMENIYPYNEVSSRDREGRRYNILPDYSDDDCYRVVGTFPNKRYLLDDNIQLEVYDKYWKYTTVTNSAGDYMIFGVPSGSQQVHVDIDLSDIGILSQKPRDFTYRGYDLSEFDSPSQFKYSTNYDSLRQIFSQDKSVYVYPFWGDVENGVAAITRCDMQIAYKFEPTCVFMGSIISDNEGNSIGHKCAPSVNNGMNDQLVAGQGTIEMIRKTTDGLVEEYPIQGNALIDNDGVWCYQIPMNLDYVGTDEYGNIVPTDNPNKGLPTRAQVRFRISKTETGDEGFSRHTAKYLVPMNPVTYEADGKVVPTTQETTGADMEKMYIFGSSTPQSCFRDLYWNNVYSVKNFIPKVQVAHRPYAPNYSALKGSNLVENQNPVPFNKLRIDIPFTYMIVCILFTIVMVIIHFINMLIWIIQMIRGLCLGFSIFGTRIEICPFKLIIPKFGCIPLSAGLSEGNVAYYPGCHCPESDACRNASCPEDMEGDCTKSSDNSELKDKIQQNLAKDYRIVKLDFYQDWLNGSLYMPLWYWRKRKKKKFLFFTISGAKNEFCDCDKKYSRLKTYVTCSMEYSGNGLETDNRTIDLDEDRWHKKKAERVWYNNGIIKGVENKDGLIAYYYTAFQPNSDDPIDINILQRNKRFMYVRLYATDIILLGNLNENNIYGIPQLYTALPSTTANIPPIASIEESLTDEKNSKDDTPRNDTAGDAEDSGTTITTGMDCGHDGGSQVPRYRKGLFMDLTCTYAATRSKACINVERLSELGVNPDMTFKMSFSNGGNDVKTGTIDSDGFVNKYELDDMDNRAAFATLNHIGFIPQDYQDSINGYTTQVQDENTGYLVPKFKYIYPIDFDGRMQLIMKDYQKGFEQATYDEPDPSYITFRLGAEENERCEENSEKRIRHYYFKRLKNGKNRYEMPLYNNSFYFYFGINKGNTAIDKFNKMFYAPCFQNERKPFTLSYAFNGRSYCPSVYPEDYIYQGFAYIRITLDDIQTPYAYRLYDSNGILVIEESGMQSRDFVIGGYIDEETGMVKSNENGVIKYQLGDNEEIAGFNGINYLTNQTYRLVITDSNGKSLAERLNINMPKVSVECESYSLGTKFYNTGSTRIDHICTDDTEFYGRLVVLSYTVDGYHYSIKSVTYVGYVDNQYVLKLDGENNDNDEMISTSVYIKVRIIEGGDGTITKDCLCDTSNTPTELQSASYVINGTIIPHWLKLEEETDDEGNPTGFIHPMFLVYQPNRFVVTISQVCDDEELENNVTSEIVNVNNGENFNTFVGADGSASTDMPVKFMLGTVTDSNEATVAVGSNFYRLSQDGLTSPNVEGLKGWFGLHDEDTYRFQRSENRVLMRNEDIWTDFVVLNEPISTHASKATILAYKFNAMFSLSSAAYVVSDTATIYHSAKGGIHPTLYRSVAPKYADVQNFSRTYILNDSNMVTSDGNFPMVIGKNYYKMDNNGYGPMFNDAYGENNKKIVGCYFAAFTHNGGYTSKTKVDSSVKVMKIPNYAKVTPMVGNVNKQIGKNVYGEIDSAFKPAYMKWNKYNPYLRTLFVDRRMDYRLVLFAPSMSNDIQLYPSGDEKKERIWKSARISGETFNGIEMSYDDEYNIISADTSGYVEEGEDEIVITTAVPNKRLEYSYCFSDNDEDARTYYNHEDNTIWEEDAILDEDTSKQIVKRFYDATYSGFDIRNFFWSTFNRERLNTYVSTQDILNDAPYVFKYPYSKTDMYNGDMNMAEVGTNYPTHRFIDICNIPPGEVHDFSITSCSYEINAFKDGDGTVKAYANAGEGVSFYDVYKPPIIFINPSDGNNDFGNAIYENISEADDGYMMFKCNRISLSFRYAEKTVEGFKVYTSIPRLGRVLNYIGTNDGKQIDGISYVKTTTQPYNGNSGEIFAAHENLAALFGDRNVFFYTFCKNGGGAPWDINLYDTSMPNGVWVNVFNSEHYKLYHHDGTKDFDMFFVTKGVDNNERNDGVLTSDDNNFLNITFKANIGINNSGQEDDEIKIFTIWLHREYFALADDKLKHQISVIEHGDLYDVRPLLIKVSLSSETTNELEAEPTITLNTYVEKVKLSPGSVSGSAYNISGSVSSDSGDEGGDDEGGGSMSDGGGDVSGESESYAYIQYITFDFKFNADADPIDRQCEAFSNYDMMRFTFRFTDKGENRTFDVEPTEIKADTTLGMKQEEGEEVEYVKDVTIHFKMRWSQDMGIIADNEWNGNSTKVTIFAKGQDDFTYKVGWFRLEFGGQEGGYDPDTKTDSGMETGEKYKTNVVIITAR